jgi:hypothetical protein
MQALSFYPSDVLPTPPKSDLSANVPKVLSSRITHTADKSVGIHSVSTHQSHPTEIPMTPLAPSFKLRALSPKVEVRLEYNYSVRRLPISKEEAEAINNGG